MMCRHVGCCCSMVWTLLSSPSRGTQQHRCLLTVFRGSCMVGRLVMFCEELCCVVFCCVLLYCIHWCTGSSCYFKTHEKLMCFGEKAIRRLKYFLITTTFTWVELNPVTKEMGRQTLDQFTKEMSPSPRGFEGLFYTCLFIDTRI